MNLRLIFFVRSSVTLRSAETKQKILLEPTFSNFWKCGGRSQTFDSISGYNACFLLYWSSFSAMEILSNSLRASLEKSAGFAFCLILPPISGSCLQLWHKPNMITHSTLTVAFHWLHVQSAHITEGCVRLPQLSLGASLDARPRTYIGILPTALLMELPHLRGPNQYLRFHVHLCLTLVLGRFHGGCRPSSDLITWTSHVE